MSQSIVWTEMLGDNGHRYLVNLDAPRKVHGHLTAPARRWVEARQAFTKTVTTGVRLDAVRPVEAVAAHLIMRECGAVYGPCTWVVCDLPDGHDGDHTMPTGDGDGVWAWAR